MSLTPSERSERDERIAEIAQVVAAAQPGPWFFTLVPEDEGNVCIKHEHWDIYRNEADVEVERSEPGILVGKIEQRAVNVACVLGDAPDLHVIANAPYYIAFLLSELRSSLAREAEAKKDAERVTWLEHALRHPDAELGTCIGDVFLSGGHRGVYIEVGDKVQESRGETLREALDVLAAPKETTKP